jgi:5'-nucleotidase
MNILVVNDDGIEAVGIRNLVEALSEAGNVYVSAPHIQRSASGHGITIGHPVRCEEVAYPGAALAYSFEGTPADCVKLGLEVYRERGILFDRVFSGINHGGNLGTDILYSGTVSAAIEGSINGIPSVAISINAREAIQYETAKSTALQVAKADLAALDPRIVLNINLPDLPAEQIKGVKWVKQGPREYIEWYNKAAAQDTGHGYV